MKLIDNSQFYEKAPSYTMFKEGWGQTEVSGGATGIARAYGGIKLGSCNQLIPNLRLQVREEGVAEHRRNLVYLMGKTLT